MRLSAALALSEHFRSLVVLWVLFPTASYHSENSQPHLYKPPCEWAHLHVHVCILEGAWTCLLSPSPPTVPPSLKHWPTLLPLLRLIDLFIMRSVFKPRTVYRVTRQTLVKCGDPETFSLWDAMSISSTAIFHRKPKEARVTTFSCGHKQWDYADEVQWFLWQPKTLPWQPMETQKWVNVTLSCLAI